MYNETYIKPVKTTIVHQFVKEIQDEFKDDPEVNLDYLTFAADHFMSKVKPVEEKMYSREEVEEIAESAYHFGRLNSTINMPKFDNWIEENLK